MIENTPLSNSPLKRREQGRGKFREKFFEGIILN
jgi:hypothetical protein